MKKDDYVTEHYPDKNLIVHTRQNDKIWIPPNERNINGSSNNPSIIYKKGQKSLNDDIKRCYRCGGKHEPKDCTNDRRCYRCGGTDHISTECHLKKNHHSNGEGDSAADAKAATPKSGSNSQNKASVGHSVHPARDPNNINRIKSTKTTRETTNTKSNSSSNGGMSSSGNKGPQPRGERVGSGIKGELPVASNTKITFD